jgi:probable F420-dependent oxidoreductase
MGLKLGIRYSDAELEDILAIAVAADGAGLESMWRGEHVLVPREIRSIDPYYARALPPGMEKFASLDPNTLAAFLAAKTEQIRFCMGVNLIALHNPYQLARVVATADIVSGGRIMMAVGIGWLREEFDIMGIDWKTRGTRTDEAMAVVRTLWRDQHPEFEGKHFHLPPVTFQPKPIQYSPPLYVAGMSRFAFRRAARYGDGWYGHDLSVTEAAEIVRTIEVARDEAGTLDRPFEYTSRAPWDISPAGVAAFGAAGVHRLVLDAGSAAYDGLSTVLQRIERIGNDLVEVQ